VVVVVVNNKQVCMHVCQAKCATVSFGTFDEAGFRGV